MNLDAEIRAASDRVQAVIERHYDQARRVLLDRANDARRRAGFMPFVIMTLTHHCVAPDRLRCPECGGRLIVEIEEWEATTGKPEEALVLCENESWDGDDCHRHRWYDWNDVHDAAYRWARSNVRVL